MAGASPVLAMPKRRAASTEVAARSACCCASASAAPASARVDRSVTARPASAKYPSASASRSGRYSGEVGGPLTAIVRLCRRMRPSTTSVPPLGRRPGSPRDPLRARLLRLYAALERRFGPQRWWPGRTRFEIAVGAILTQHAAWTNVERALRALRARRLIAPGTSAEAVRALVEAHLPADPGLFNEYHALLVAVGKRHCRPVPRCRGCPLRFDLHGRPPCAT